MSFTTIELVKKHLTDYRLGTKRIENEPFLMPASGYSNLQFGNIEKDTDRVKARELNTPFSEDLMFDITDKTSLAHSEIIADTVVTASNSSMGEIYTENVDFSIDYDNGTITRIPDGAIPPVSSFTIWYQYYRVYERSVDYFIDYTDGKISLAPSGSIEAGQLVYVDYISMYGNITDESIDNSIIEAAEKVLSVIDPIYQTSEDQALTTAETYLTLAIICRIKAIEAAGRPEQTTSGFRGDFWAKLSNSYTIEGFKILEHYARPVNSLASPKLSKNQN